jgi:predicted site-specific integrase-resolvase
MQENQILRYLREQEAADFISVSVQTLRNWRHRGEGPKFHKPTPKVVRYRLDELKQFMEQK